MLSQEADHVATQVRGSTALDSIIWLFNSCDALCQSMTYSTALTVEELKDLSIIPDTSAMNDDFCALVENLFGSWAWVSSTFGRCDFLCFHKSQGKLPSAGAVRDDVHDLPAKQRGNYTTLVRVPRANRGKILTKSLHICCILSNRQGSFRVCPPQHHCPSNQNPKAWSLQSPVH